MLKNLVFSGGEFKGLAYIGVLKFLEENELIDNIENILSVSSGSMISLMIALGFKSSQIEKIAISFKMEELKDIHIGNIVSFFERFGIDSGKNLERVIKIIVKKKLGNENATFRDLHEKYPKPQLIITGTNLNTASQEIYSYTKTPDMILWEAIRISTCVPLYFQSFIKEGNLLVDGGIINNYPINYFKNELECTLGIALRVSGSSTEIDSFDKFIIALLNSMNSLQNYLEKEYEPNTIILQVNKTIVDLDFSEPCKKEIIQSGYNQFSQQFYQKGFDKFLPKKIDNSNQIDYNQITQLNTIDLSNNQINNIFTNISQETPKSQENQECQFTMDLITDIQSIISRHSNSPDYIEEIENIE